MDDILKSIRRIIRSDQTEGVEENKDVVRPVKVREKPKVVQQELSVAEEQPEIAETETGKSDSNLIRMKIHDQKRLRILEKKLQTIEAEYEQKLQLHRQKMTDYRRQNQQLSAAVNDYKSKLGSVSNSLKTAYDALEKLQVKNKALKTKVLQMSRLEQGTAVLKTIQREFTNLYHPDRTHGDNISRSVRSEVFNEFNQVLQGVQSRFQSRRM